MRVFKEKYYELVCLLLFHRNPIYSEIEWRWYVVFILSIMESWFFIGIFSVVNWMTGHDIYENLFIQRFLSNKISLYAFNVFLWLLPLLVINYFVVLKRDWLKELDRLKMSNVPPSKAKIYLFLLISGGFTIVVSLIRIYL